MKNDLLENSQHEEGGLTCSELGKKSDYDDRYSPEKLFAISRDSKRKEINVDPTDLPFYGFDRWNHYEVSWLNAKGKPVVAIAEIVYDCHSPNIVESKSLKPYFNSLNNTQFNSMSSVKEIIEKDLSNCVGSPVNVIITELSEAPSIVLQPGLSGLNIDSLDVLCDEYTVNPRLLSIGAADVEETLVSDLLKSNCLVTNQPDWGSVLIHYRGKQIDHEGLLKYIISFRNHNEFHEQCIERIFNDILTRCRPEILTVYGRYTRRGGLDINPYRSTEQKTPDSINTRLIRQ